MSFQKTIIYNNSFIS